MTDQDEQSKENLQENVPDTTQVSDIIEDIIENAPNVSETIDGCQPTDNHVDRYGNPFQVGVHKADQFGEPVLNKNGTLKIVGRAKHDSKDEALSNKNAGQLFATYTIVIATSLFGEDFQPTKTKELDELTMLSTAYAEYFETKNIEDVPPVYVLLGSLSLYFLPRLMIKKTQQSIASKIKFLWRKCFPKKGL